MSIIQQGSKSLGMMMYAKECVELAQGIESRHSRSFGGHRHEGGGHPLLAFPLPQGYRKKVK